MASDTLCRRRSSRRPVGRASAAHSPLPLASEATVCTTSAIRGPSTTIKAVMTSNPRAPRLQALPWLIFS